MGLQPATTMNFFGDVTGFDISANPSMPLRQSPISENT